MCVCVCGVFVCACVGVCVCAFYLSDPGVVAKLKYARKHVVNTPYHVASPCVFVCLCVCVQCSVSACACAPARPLAPVRVSA